MLYIVYAVGDNGNQLIEPFEVYDNKKDAEKAIKAYTQDSYDEWQAEGKSYDSYGDNLTTADYFSLPVTAAILEQLLQVIVDETSTDNLNRLLQEYEPVNQVR